MNELALQELAKEIHSCQRCSLYKTAKNKVIIRSGFNRSATIMFIGEAPGKDEDIKGEPFVGKSGKELTHQLDRTGLTDYGYVIVNVVKCRPVEFEHALADGSYKYKNRPPSSIEIGGCIGYLKRQIELLNPKIIVTLGVIARNAVIDLKSVVGDRKIINIYHPAVVLYNPDKRGAFETQFNMLKKFVVQIVGEKKKWF